MEVLHLEQSPKTPLVHLHPQLGTLEFQGRSIPENSLEFYAPVYQWIDQYSHQPKAKTTVHIQLEYFNTSSSKCLFDIFKKLQGIHQQGKSEVTVNWFYEEEDEDMLEVGEDYQAIIKIPFVMNRI